MPCPTCGGERWLCEEHQDQPMGHDGCSGAGDPCPDCQPADRPLHPPGFVTIARVEDDPVPFGYLRCPSCRTAVRLPAHEPVVPQDPAVPPGLDLAFGKLESIECPTCGATVTVPDDHPWYRP